MAFAMVFRDCCATWCTAWPRGWSAATSASPGASPVYAPGSTGPTNAWWRSRLREASWPHLGDRALGPSHANKLLAGYIALRCLGIEANFVDILLLQTFITFLCTSRRRPGRRGSPSCCRGGDVALRAASAGPSYTLIWRFINSYATVIFGSVLFWRWLRSGLIGMEEEVEST